jgi:hypothetical protein
MDKKKNPKKILYKIMEAAVKHVKRLHILLEIRVKGGMAWLVKATTTKKFGSAHF